MAALPYAQVKYIQKNELWFKGSMYDILAY